jgi:hypothetical protein
MLLAADRPSAVILAVVVLYLHGKNAGIQWGTMERAWKSHVRRPGNYIMVGGGYFVSYKKCFILPHLDTKVTQKKSVCFRSGVCQIGIFCNLACQKERSFS